MTAEGLCYSWDATMQLQTKASGNRLSEDEHVAAHVGLDTMPVYDNSATHLFTGTETSARKQSKQGKGATCEDDRQLWMEADS